MVAGRNEHHPSCPLRNTASRASSIFRRISDGSLIYQELAQDQNHCNHLSSQCDVQVIITEADRDVDKLEYQKPAYVAVALIMAVTTLTVFFPMMLVALSTGSIPSHDQGCSGCRISLVESMPENLTYVAGSLMHPSTFSAWTTLVQNANVSIDIASFYWTMRPDDLNVSDPTDWQGEAIFEHLLRAGRDRGIKIRIAQNLPSPSQPNKDTEFLASKGAAAVRSLNFSRYFDQGGVLHTKLWIVDGQHVYIGSANMDWRSLTQVKELGALITNCSCIAHDVQKLFDVYWLLAQPDESIPKQWPLEYHTKFNMNNPMQVLVNDSRSQVFLSSSPPAFCPPQRTSDIDAILGVIHSAQHYVHIAVMDYFPKTLYSRPTKFWPVIDDALREVAIEKGVKVRLLASWWSHSRKDLPNYLTSLEALNGASGASIEARLFHVPAYSEAQSHIPFARVNHNKYMVTDNTAYIGTSNWSADYFISTGGVGLIVNQTEALFNHNATQTLQQQLAATFERDWFSNHSLPVSEYPEFRDKYL